MGRKGKAHVPGFSGRTIGAMLQKRSTAGAQGTGQPKKPADRGSHKK